MYCLLGFYFIVFYVPAVPQVTTREFSAQPRRQSDIKLDKTSMQSLVAEEDQHFLVSSPSRSVVLHLRFRPRAPLKRRCTYTFIVAFFDIVRSPWVGVCVCCHEVALCNSVRRRWWWRAYWLADQAPGVSTCQMGDSWRLSYRHTELICPSQSMAANWSYHCAASHVRVLARPGLGRLLLPFGCV